MRLQSAPNFRDLGGIVCAHGRTLKQGLLFRSEALTKLSIEDFARLQSCGLHTVIDLRSAGECARFPTPWPEHFRPAIKNWDVNVDAQAESQEVFATLRADPTATGAREQIKSTYRLFPAAFAPHLRSLFEHLLDQETRPLLFHCAVGKDRTGFLAAIILLALGAERDAVLDDYMRTHGNVDTAPLAKLTTRILERQLGFVPAPEVVDILIGVHVDNLAAAIAKIDTDFGSVPAYLAAAGVTAEIQHALQQRLLST
jgi:protein-tyrosine phosphatase